MTPWTIAQQTPLSMGFPRQEYWSGLLFPSTGDLSNPGIKHMSPALQVDSLPQSHQRSPCRPKRSALFDIRDCCSGKLHYSPVLELSVCLDTSLGREFSHLLTTLNLIETPKVKRQVIFLLLLCKNLRNFLKATQLNKCQRQ